MLAFTWPIPFRMFGIDDKEGDKDWLNYWK